MTHIKSFLRLILRLITTWIVVTPLAVFACMGQLIIVGTIPIDVFDVLVRYLIVFVAGASFWAILQPRFTRWWKEMRGE